MESDVCLCVAIHEVQSVTTFYCFNNYWNCRCFVFCCSKVVGVCCCTVEVQCLTKVCLYYGEVVGCAVSKRTVVFAKNFNENCGNKFWCTAAVRVVVLNFTANSDDVAFHKWDFCNFTVGAVAVCAVRSVQAVNDDGTTIFVCQVEVAVLCVVDFANDTLEVEVFVCCSAKFKAVCNCNCIACALPFDCCAVYVNFEFCCCACAFAVEVSNEFDCCFFCWKFGDYKFAICDGCKVVRLVQAPSDSNVCIGCACCWQCNFACFGDVAFYRKVVLFEFNFLCRCEFWSCDVGDAVCANWVDLVQVAVARNDTLDCCGLTNFELSENFCNNVAFQEVVGVVDVVFYAVNCEVVVLAVFSCEDCVFKNYEFVLVLSKCFVIALILCTAPSSCYVFVWKVCFYVTGLSYCATGIEFVLTAVNCTCTCYDNFCSVGEVCIECFFACCDGSIESGFVSVVAVSVFVLDVQATLGATCCGNCADNVASDGEHCAALVFAVFKVFFPCSHLHCRLCSFEGNGNFVSICIHNCTCENVRNVYKAVFVNDDFHCVVSSVDVANVSVFCMVCVNCNCPSDGEHFLTDTSNCCYCVVSSRCFVFVHCVDVVTCVLKVCEPFVNVGTTKFVSVANTVVVFVHVNRFAKIFTAVVTIAIVVSVVVSNANVTNVANVVAIVVFVLEICFFVADVAISVVVAVVVLQANTTTVTKTVFVCVCVLESCCCTTVVAFAIVVSIFVAHTDATTIAKAVAVAICVLESCVALANVALAVVVAISVAHANVTCIALAVSVSVVVNVRCVSGTYVTLSVVVVVVVNNSHYLVTHVASAVVVGVYVCCTRWVTTHCCKKAERQNNCKNQNQYSFHVFLLFFVF